MEPLYCMSTTELARLKGVQDVLDGRASLTQVASQLRLSVRQLKRLVRAYRTDGPRSLISKRRGRPSNRRLDPTELNAAIARIQERYPDFGPTLAAEKLAELDGIVITRERLRQGMIAAGIWQPKRRRRPRLHPPRERRHQFGELVQGDGSPHDWFEGRAPRCSLLQFIDDATNTIGAALFAPTESTQAYFDLIEQYIGRYGKPFALYVDKFSVFRATHPGEQHDRTQFARAMEELGIEIICAHSPQAKGRVERSNRTLQDRLVKELRLFGINDISAANAFLGDFLVRYNARFSVPPKSNLDAHRPLAASEDLRRILTQVEERIVSKNLTFKYKGDLFCIVAPGNERRLAHQRILIRESAGVLSIEYRGVALAFERIPLVVRPVLEAKALNEHLDRSRLGPRLPDPKRQHPPSPKHPWRAYPRRPSATP